VKILAFTLQVLEYCIINLDFYTMLFSFLITAFTTFLHPLHVSVTEIKFDAKDKELEVTTRIFLDDLEEAIRQERKQSTLDITQPGAGLTTDQLLNQYLSNRLQIKVDGKNVKIIFLGYEIEGDAIIVYAYAPGVKKMKEIEVTHTTITEVYEDQSNLVHVTREDKTKSLRLMRSQPTDKLQFD
jgi:hypothetical protein